MFSFLKVVTFRARCPFEYMLRKNSPAKIMRTKVPRKKERTGNEGSPLVLQNSERWMIRWASHDHHHFTNQSTRCSFSLGIVQTLHSVSSGSKVENFPKFQLSTPTYSSFNTPVQSIQIKVLRRRYDMTIKSRSIQRMGWCVCLSIHDRSLSWTRSRTRTINNNRFLWMKMDRFVSFSLWISLREEFY